MRFPYRTYEVAGTPASPAGDGYIHRPVVPFSLAGPGGTLDFFGLLDSGADETYITRAMAERLGLVIDEKLEYVIESAGGEVSVAYGEAMLEVIDGEELYRWRATIGVTDQDWSEAILGHSGFLEFFDVLLRGHEHEVVMTRNGAAFRDAMS